MALILSDRAEKLSQEINIEANIILKIEDDAFPELFGFVDINRSLRVGDFIIGDGSVVGGVVRDENSRAWIQEQGTTDNISQKVDTDKDGGSSSISTFNVNLIDKNNELTKIFSPGVRVPDILGLRATIYWTPQSGSHPEDSVAVFRGVISTITMGSGNISLIIDSPEQLKRQDLLIDYSNSITADIDSIVTTIPVLDVTGFITSQDSLTSYIRIDDEIIEVGSVSGNSFINCTRASLNTIASSHDLDNEVSSFYRLQEQSPIDLALKLILSGAGIFGDGTATRINQISDILFSQNSIFIPNEFFQQETGLVTGDTGTISGAINPSNNIIDRVIIEITKVTDGTIIRFSGTDMLTEGGIFSLSFKSKYDVLNFGCAIEPYHVDVERFEQIKDLTGTQYPAIDAYIKETINAREYIDSQILWPVGMFGVFRKGRISIGANLPPLSTQNTKILNSDTVKKAESIKVKRSFKSLFYNAIVFKFEENVLDERFLAGRVIQSADSTNRINIGNKALVIEANGIRNNPVNVNKLDTISRRILDRYQYGAESIEVETNFKTGFTIEVGDSVIYEGESLKTSDSTSGTREYIPRVLEVVNKSFSLKRGRIKLSLIDSNFGVNGRYGVISPASKVDIGSTVSSIKLKRSFATIEGVPETKKWVDYVGQRIQVRSPNYAFQEVVTIQSIDPTNPNNLIVQPNLSIAPSSDYIIESPDYDETNSRVDSFYKSQHTYPAKEIDIISGVSNTQFNVLLIDAANIVIGDSVLVHSHDYSDNIEVIVSNKVGTLITVSDMGFTADSTYGAISIRFLDNNYVYRAF